MKPSENNRLIAEFMDFPDLGTEGDFSYLKYHEYWKWLMPVVEKIESLRDVNGNAYRFTIDMCNAQIEGTHIKILGGSHKINATYKAVVEFIKKYTTEDNKLIAEFMGANPFRESVNEDVLSYEMYGLVENIEDGLNEKHFFLPSEMKYNTSWDWLMPVINKCYQEHMSKNIAEAVMNCDIDGAYKEVIEFIKEYN